MPKHDADFWNRARSARNKLVKQYITYPDVTLIDIGYAADPSDVTDTLVLRIHVREGWKQTSQQERVDFPTAVDGIPVVVLSGDYDLANDAPADE